MERLAPINPGKLDVAKTWYMIQSLIGTQCVQCIFLDRSIQVRLYQYALHEGGNPDDLAKIFSGARRGAKTDGLIQHAPGHLSHMHVRFFAPWSTLAGTLKGMDPQRQMMIETAEWFNPIWQANPLAKEGSETRLKQMAHYIGVTPWAN
jgi:hypothetical protein